MDTIDRARVQELLRESDELPHGSTRIGIVEEAVRLADLMADLDLAYEARTNLIESANFGGAPEKALVAFTWCLAQLDKDPERFNEFYTLWQYKWVISSLPAFPQLSRAQIAAAQADFRLRFQRGDYGMRPIYKLDSCVARDMGDDEVYHKAHALWLKSPRSGMSDCETCDLSSEVEYLARNGQEEKALERARPILTGKARCEEEPHTTLAELLLPLVKLERLEEAVAYHLKGYRLISKNRNFLKASAQHLQFLTLTDNLAKALKLFEAHLVWSLESPELDCRFHFSLASRFLFERLLASGKKTVKLRLPSSFPLSDASGKYEVLALIAWLDADSAEIARRFDARNGNNGFALKIEANRGLEAFIKPFPVHKPRTPRQE